MGRSLAVLSLVALLTAGCSTLSLGPMSSMEFSKEIDEVLADGDVHRADRLLGEMELYHPDSPDMQIRYVKLIEAYYKADEMLQASKAATRFSKMYPEHPEIARVYYIGGLAYYELGVKEMALENGEESSLAAREGLKLFDALKQCCIDSEYVLRAREKANDLGIKVARYEFNVMRQEFRDGDYTTALLIAQYIVRRFPNEDVAGLAALMVAASDDPVKLARLLEVTEDENVTAREVRAILSGSSIPQPEPEKEPAKPVEQVSFPQEGIFADPAEKTVGFAAEQVPVQAVSAVADVAQAVVSAAAVATPATAAKEVVAPLVEPEKTMAAKPRLYTIQLSSASSIESLKEQMQSLGLAAKVDYQERLVNGKKLYSALYGGYSSWGEAKAALPQVKESTTVKDAWIKRMPTEGLLD